MGVEVSDDVKIDIRIQRRDTLCYAIPPPSEDSGGRREHRQPDGPLAERGTLRLDHAAGIEAQIALHASELSKEYRTKEKHDIFTPHYHELRCGGDHRQRLIENPIAGLKEHFGVMPTGDYKVEVVAEERDTITIMLPQPSEGDITEAAIGATSRRIYDILFTEGAGGYLIADDGLTWVLRDMRSLWSKVPVKDEP